MCNHCGLNAHNLSQVQVSGVNNGSLKVIFSDQKGSKGANFKNIGKKMTIKLI